MRAHRRLLLTGILLLDLSFDLSSAAQRVKIEDDQNKVVDALPWSQRAMLLGNVRPQIVKRARDGAESNADLARRVRDDLAALQYAEVNPGKPLFVFLGNNFGLCGLNCAIWVVDSRGHLLLRGGGNALTFLPERHKGLADVKAEVEDSAFITLVTYYRFDGHRYREHHCTREVIDDSSTSDSKPRVEIRACDEL